MSGWGIKRDKLDKVVSDLVRYRDKWTCQRCLNSCEPFKGMECAHFKSRIHKSTRYDLSNCDTLCTGCHSYLQRNQDEHRAWKVKRLGEDNVVLLEYKARHPLKMNKNEKEILYQDLKKQLKRQIETEYTKVPF